MVAGDTQAPPDESGGASVYTAKLRLKQGAVIIAKFVDALRVTPGVPCRLPMTILRGAGGTMVPPGP